MTTIFKRTCLVLMIILISGQSGKCSENEFVYIKAESNLYGVQINVGNDTNKCGGGIYSDRIIITAASCLHEIFGELPQESSKQAFVVCQKYPYPQVKVAVKTISVHPDYNNNERIANIAMLLLENPLVLEDLNKKPNKLPAFNHTFTKEEEKLYKSEGLAVYRHVSNCQCIPKESPEYEAVFCSKIRFTKHGDPICMDISITTLPGYTLVVNNVLYGISISGHSCNTEKYCHSNMFIKVSKYVHWIVDTAEKLSAKDTPTTCLCKEIIRSTEATEIPGTTVTTEAAEIPTTIVTLETTDIPETTEADEIAETTATTEAAEVPETIVTLETTDIPETTEPSEIFLTTEFTKGAFTTEISVINRATEIIGIIEKGSSYNNWIIGIVSVVVAVIIVVIIVLLKRRWSFHHDVAVAFRTLASNNDEVQIININEEMEDKAYDEFA